MTKEGRRPILLIFAELTVTTLLASLDQTIFSTALPTIVAIALFIVGAVIGGLSQNMA